MPGIVTVAPLRSARALEDLRCRWRQRSPRFPTSPQLVSTYCIVQYMLTIPSRLDVMNRLGRAMADANRSRILLSLLEGPGYPAELARDLGLTRTNVSNHLSCLRGCGIIVAEPEGRRTRYEIADAHLAHALNALLETTLAVDENVDCLDPQCGVPGCCDSRKEQN